jgi:hypothetical protein
MLLPREAHLLVLHLQSVSIAAARSTTAAVAGNAARASTAASSNSTVAAGATATATASIVTVCSAATKLMRERQRESFTTYDCYCSRHALLWRALKLS